MSKKIVIFEVDENRLNELGTTFRDELNLDWESVIQVKKIIDVPKVIDYTESVETLWIYEQVIASLDALVQNKEIESYDEQTVFELVGGLQDNMESIDQDIHWRVCDYLEIKC